MTRESNTGILRFNFASILFHGSTSSFTDIDLTKGKNYKDFGKGFYLSVNRQHSLSLAKSRLRFSLRNLKQATRSSYYLYTYAINFQVFRQLNVKCFTDKLDWLRFILFCRRHKGVPHAYDIVVGLTADASTTNKLSLYESDAYGRVGSDSALWGLYNALEVERLSIQYCFCTERSKLALQRIKMEVFR